MSDALTPRQTVDNLVAALNVRPDGEDRFSVPPQPDSEDTGNGRLFGGLVIAQTLAAAEATVAADRPVHSLHAYFLRMGNGSLPIRFEVDRDLDGGSFSNRRVHASQNGRPILSMMASFQRADEAYRHQDPMPDVPGPDDVRPDSSYYAQLLDRLPEVRRKALAAPRPFEMRTLGGPRWITSEPGEPVSHQWLRAAAPVGDDPRLNRLLLAYATDLALMPTAMRPHGVSGFRGDVQEASLDHAIWFHDEFRVDDWLLYRTHSGWTGGARGHITGQLFTQDGRLVASVSQEGMIRLPRKR